MRSSLFERENGFNKTRLAVCLAAIVLCACIAGEALGTDLGGNTSPPGDPLPAPDSPLPWQTGLFGKSENRAKVADLGITAWGWAEYHTPANVWGGIDTSVEPLTRFYGAGNFDTGKLTKGWWKGGHARHSMGEQIRRDISPRTSSL